MPNVTIPTPSPDTINLLLPFLSLILGILLSILVAFVARWLYEGYKEPELVINNNTTVSDSDGFTISLIEVVNEGESAATNCAPTVAIPEIESEMRRDSPYSNREPLLSEPLDNSITGATFWLSEQHKSGKTINKDSSAWACICRMSGKNEGSIEIPSEDGWEQPLAVLLKSQSPYHIEFQATARECSSESVTYELQTSGNSLRLTKIS